MANWRMGFFLIVFCLAASLANSGEPPDQPMLRLESGMHTAMIRRIAVDRAGRYLVTASDDKTARVWDLTDGRLLNTLRPPMGEGADEGKLYATAISPDGATVAVGGWTGYGWDGASSIYLFDRASGELRRRLTDLPLMINHLAWSADGQYLAATLGGKNGVRVFSTRNGQQVMADGEYGGKSYWADFDPQGRLVTSCYDGYLRLYNAAFKPITKVFAPGGKEPFGVAFSPDGGRIAVGFRDSTAVNILDGKDLTLLYSADTSGVDNGSLNSVAWSADGRWLYGGGRYQKNRMFPIRKWADRGKGKFQDFAVSPGTIMDLRPLSDGRLVFGTGDPLWGVMDGKGEVVHRQEANGADYRNNLQGFRISQDGGQVAFGFEVFGKRPARFSLVEGRLELSPHGEANLTPPRTQADGLVVTDWRNNTPPKLNGQPLALDQHEVSLSLAIAPGGQSFLLGADWTLRHFDRQGKKKWQVAVPEVVWGVNVSGDGRLAVAAFGDGTIRWYGMEDGKELLAFYPHKDGKRWVAWTPSGYYQASVGGEELIGWHVNQGKEKEGAFYPVSRFRDTYSRPDVVARVLVTLDEKEALRLADGENPRRGPAIKVTERLPPVVHLLSPQDGEGFTSEEVTLRYQAKGLPLTGIKILVDGRPLESKGIVVQGGESQQLTVTLPKRDVTVGVIAENRHGTSEPALARLVWRGAAQVFVVKPKLYILAIGVSNYRDQTLKLKFAAKDAVDFVAAMERGEGGGLYEKVVAKKLADATREQVLQGLEWLERETTAKDVAMLFLSGHGMNDRNNSFYFLPQDGNPDSLKSSAINYAMIKETITTLPGKTLAFLDTCHSGNIMGSQRKGVADITQVVNDLITAENGVVVFASATKRQFSLERAEWGNGAFTKALVEGLSGKARAAGGGQITISGLEGYLYERVKALTNGQQTPTTTKPKTIEDFPLVIVQ